MVLLGLKELLVYKEYKVPQDQLDKMELMVKMDRMDLMALLDLQALKVFKEYEVPQDRLAKTELTVRMELTVKMDRMD